MCFLRAGASSPATAICVGEREPPIKSSCCKTEKKRIMRAHHGCFSKAATRCCILERKKGVRDCRFSVFGGGEYHDVKSDDDLRGLLSKDAATRPLERGSEYRGNSLFWGKPEGGGEGDTCTTGCHALSYCSHQATGHRAHLRVRAISVSTNQPIRRPQSGRGASLYAAFGFETLQLGSKPCRAAIRGYPAACFVQERKKGFV